MVTLPFVPSHNQEKRRGRRSQDLPPLHLRLPSLGNGYQLILDYQLHYLALLHEHLQTQHALIIARQQVSQAGLRVLIPLLKSPGYCPYDYILAAHEIEDWELLSRLLVAPTLESDAEFSAVLVPIRQRLHDLRTRFLRLDIADPVRKKLAKQWDWEIRPARRLMQDLSWELAEFGGRIHLMRLEGYRLEWMPKHFKEMQPISKSLFVDVISE